MAEVFVYLGLWFVFLLALAHAVLFLGVYCEFMPVNVLPEVKVDANREFVCSCQVTGSIYQPGDHFK